MIALSHQPVALLPYYPPCPRAGCALWDEVHRARRRAARRRYLLRKPANWRTRRRKDQKRRASARRAAEAAKVEQPPKPPRMRARDVKELMLARDRRCAYCRCRLDADSATIDHVLPKVRGGAKKDRRNLILACPDCNAMKSWRTPWEWYVAMIRTVLWMTVRLEFLRRGAGNRRRYDVVSTPTGVFRKAAC